MTCTSGRTGITAAGARLASNPGGRPHGRSAVSLALVIHDVLQSEVSLYAGSHEIRGEPKVIINRVSSASRHHMV